MIQRVIINAAQTVRGYMKKLHLTKKNGVIAVVIIIAAVASLIFVFNRMEGSEVNALAVTAEAYEEKIIAVGQLQLARETTLIAEVSGEILSIGAKEGDAISAGDIIISIDDAGQSYLLEQRKFSYDNESSEYRNLVELEYASAKEELAGLTSKKEQVRKSYTAAESLYQEGALSQVDYLKYKSDYEEALAMWNKATLKLRSLSENGSLRASAYSQMQSAQSSYESALNDHKNYQITVPWDSVLLKSYVSEHDYVQPGDPLADIGEEGSYYAVAELDDKYFPYLYEGMRAIIFMGDSTTGKGAEGIVDVISRKINDETGAFEVKVAIVEEVPYLASNLTVNIVIIAAEEPSAISIPQEYLINGDSAVFLYQNGKAVKTEIEFEERPTPKILITKGLSEGDIIIRPDATIKDGSEVEPVKGVEPS